MEKLSNVTVSQAQRAWVLRSRRGYKAATLRMYSVYWQGKVKRVTDLKWFEIREHQTHQKKNFSDLNDFDKREITTVFSPFDNHSSWKVIRLMLNPWRRPASPKSQLQQGRRYGYLWYLKNIYMERCCSSRTNLQTCLWQKTVSRLPYVSLHMGVIPRLTSSVQHVHNYITLALDSFQS